MKIRMTLANFFANQPTMVEYLKSKLHRAKVTAASLDYEGSITIDAALMAEVGFSQYEKVLVANLANGNRFETYIISGRAGSGEIILNGATAHLGRPGDLLTIMSFVHLTAEQALKHEPRMVTLDAQNRPLSKNA